MCAHFYPANPSYMGTQRSLLWFECFCTNVQKATVVEHSWPFTAFSYKSKRTEWQCNEDGYIFEGAACLVPPNRPEIIKTTVAYNKNPTKTWNPSCFILSWTSYYLKILFIFKISFIRWGFSPLVLWKQGETSWLTLKFWSRLPRLLCKVWLQMTSPLQDSGACIPAITVLMFLQWMQVIIYSCLCQQTQTRMSTDRENLNSEGEHD